MIELIIIVAVIIIIWRLWISHTNKVRNEKQRPQMEEKERNAVAFINDVISVIDRSAPYFKYITMNCVSYDLDFGDIIIVNADNKVSLFVRYINIADGTYETRIVNKHQD